MGQHWHCRWLPRIGQIGDVGHGSAYTEYERKPARGFELLSYGQPPELGRAFRYRCYTGPRNLQRRSN